MAHLRVTFWYQMPQLPGHAGESKQSERKKVTFKQLFPASTVPRNDTTLTFEHCKKTFQRLCVKKSSKKASATSSNVSLPIPCSVKFSTPISLSHLRQVCKTVITYYLLFHCHSGLCQAEHRHQELEHLLSLNDFAHLT